MGEIISLTASPQFIRHLRHLMSLANLSSVPSVRKLIKQVADAEHARISQLVFIQAITGAGRKAIDMEVERSGSLETVFHSCRFGGLSYKILKESAETKQCPTCPL